MSIHYYSQQLFWDLVNVQGLIDLKDPLFNPVNEMRAAMALSEYIRDNDEKMLVHGVVIVNDGTNVPMKYMTRTSMDFNKKSMKVYQVRVYIPTYHLALMLICVISPDVLLFVWRQQYSRGNC